MSIGGIDEGWFRTGNSIDAAGLISIAQTLALYSVWETRAWDLRQSQIEKGLYQPLFACDSSHINVIVFQEGSMMRVGACHWWRILTWSWTRAMLKKSRCVEAWLVYISRNLSFNDHPRHRRGWMPWQTNGTELQSSNGLNCWSHHCSSRLFILLWYDTVATPQVEADIMQWTAWNYLQQMTKLLLVNSCYCEVFHLLTWSNLFNRFGIASIVMSSWVYL